MYKKYNYITLKALSPLKNAQRKRETAAVITPAPPLIPLVAHKDTHFFTDNQPYMYFLTIQLSGH